VAQPIHVRPGSGILRGVVQEGRIASATGGREGILYLGPLWMLMAVLFELGCRRQACIPILSWIFRGAWQ